MNARPKASCSRPVWPSVAISARPGDAAAHRPHRGQRQRQRQQREQGERPVRSAISAASANGTSRNSRYTDRARASPIRTASVRLPDVASDPMSRRLLTISSAQDSSPAGTDAASPSQRQPAHLHVRGPGDRGDAEEDEHGHLAEPPVPVRPRPAGVEPGREHAQRPAGDDPPRGHRGEHQPARSRPRRSRRRRRSFTCPGDAAPIRPAASARPAARPRRCRARRRCSRWRSSPRSAARAPRAARAAARQKRELAVPGRHTRPDQHRHHCRRQGPGPRPRHPLPRASHWQILCEAGTRPEHLGRR